MTASDHAVSTSQEFGAKPAGVILLVTLIAYVFTDYGLGSFLEYLNGLAGPFFVPAKTENELRAMRSALLGILNPFIVAVVSFSFLKLYLPNSSIASLRAYFGIAGRPSPRIAVASFICGLLYLAFFLVLKRVFPPNEFVMPHPDHVINFGSLAEKLVFAVTAFTLVPIAEEFLFRGVLYKGLATSWGKPVAAVLVSVIFISLHPASIESGYWVTHASLYLFPFLMIALREITDSLYAPMAAHSAFNFAEVFF